MEKINLQDVVGVCSGEDQQTISNSLDKKVSSFLPLQENTIQIVELCKILTVKQAVKNDHTSQSEEVYKTLATETLILIEQVQSQRNQPLLALLVQLFEHTIAIFSEENFLKVYKQVLIHCKLELLDSVRTLWFEGSLTDSIKTKVHLELLEVLINQIAKYENKEKILNEIFDDDMCQMILRLSSCTVDQISSRMTMQMIPKMMIDAYRPALLHRLWDLIASQVKQENGRVVIDNNAVFMLLCSLIEFFLPSSSNTNQSFVLHNNEFWHIIQNGIIHKDQVIRKQARYLLKRALDFIHNNKITVKTDCFKWDIQNTLQDWDQFFLVIESLEEKQVHLIKPMFPLVENLFQTMDLQWSLCALHQVIHHDNNFIIRWGLYFFFQNLSQTSGTSLFILQTILPALNNTALFNMDTGNVSEMSTGLKTLFQNIASLNDTQFFKNLLISLTSISWSPVALFHISQAVGSVIAIHAWDIDDLLVLKKLLIEVLATHSVFLRSASQSFLLRGMLRLIDTDHIDLSIVADVLATFNNAESMKRGTTDWDLVVQWLKLFVNSNSAEQFLATSLNYIDLKQSGSNFKIVLNSKAISRTIVLLSDAGLLNVEVLKSSLEQITTKLINCAERLYIDQSKVDATLDFLENLFSECGTKDRENDQTRKLLVSTVLPLLPSILSYLQVRLADPLTLHDYHAVKIYLATTEMLTSTPQLSAWVFSQDVLCIDLAIQILNDKNIDSIVQKYYAAQIIEWISNCILKNRQNLGGMQRPLDKLKCHIVATVNNGRLNTNCPRPAGKELTRDLQAFWGRMTSDQLKATWTTLHNLLQCEQNSYPEFVLSPSLSCSELLSQAVEGIEIGGPQILPPIMSVLRYCLYKEEDTQLVKKILQKCYTLSFEYRKTDLFWLAIETFIGMVFNKNILSRHDVTVDIKEFAESIFEHSQVMLGLYNLVVQQITSDTEMCDTETLSLILKNGLIFGPVLRKDLRIDHQTCLYIESLGDEIPVNSLVPSMCNASQEIRATCVSLLMTRAEKHPELLESVTKDLVVHDKTKSARKYRYFADSLVHRVKHRTAQVLLMLQPFLSQGLCEVLLEWACNSLIEESHQPSVRYLIEWLIVRLLLTYPNFEQTFLNNMKESADKRQGSITSYISMLYLWVQGRVEVGSNVASLADKASQLILPWSMAQQYNLRLYAQVALMRIWKLCEEDLPAEKQELDQVVARYAPLLTALQISLEQGNGVKNALRLQDDFYFRAFKPIQHFSLETIFYEVPRLSNVTQDEWILPHKFGGGDNLSIKRTNTDTILQQFNVANWILKSTGGGHTPDVEDEVSSSVVQRKVTPWKDMFPEQTSREQRKEVPQGGLIVVASLIDRAPNLGGLSRTCEVLAASELILGNLKITEDMMFQSLSVSAEKWINLSEVRVQQLPEYLVEMKKQGYTLVAAEQTSHSVPLNKMNFPKQTLLLLGNEKEGIPAELLPLLDVCVEIPQHGVVRSLNVHVTGALFIWQYFQQHQL